MPAGYHKATQKRSILMKSLFMMSLLALLLPATAAFAADAVLTKQNSPDLNQNSL
jgi:hypothetical protein